MKYGTIMLYPLDDDILEEVNYTYKAQYKWLYGIYEVYLDLSNRFDPVEVKDEIKRDLHISGRDEVEFYINEI